MVSLGVNVDDYARFARVIHRLGFAGVFSDANLATVAAHLLHCPLAQLTANPPTDSSQWQITPLAHADLWVANSNNPEFGLLVYHDNHWDAAVRTHGMPPLTYQRYGLPELWRDAQAGLAAMSAAQPWAAYQTPFDDSLNQVLTYIAAEDVRTAITLGVELPVPVLYALLANGAQQTRTIRDCMKHPYSMHRHGAERDVVFLEPVLYGLLRNRARLSAALKNWLQGTWGGLRMHEMIVVMPIVADGMPECLTVTLTVRQVSVHHATQLPPDMQRVMDILLDVWLRDVLPDMWKRRWEKPSGNQAEKLRKPMPHTPGLELYNYTEFTDLRCVSTRALAIYYAVAFSVRKYGDGTAISTCLVRLPEPCMPVCMCVCLLILTVQTQPTVCVCVCVVLDCTCVGVGTVCVESGSACQLSLRVLLVPTECS